MAFGLVDRMSLVGLASALAGGILLVQGMIADLAIHDRAHSDLLAQLPPQAARIVSEHQTREAANPWHRTVAVGEAFLILGLGGLYLTERARRVRLQGPTAKD